MLNVVMLSVVRLSVGVLNVVAPTANMIQRYKNILYRNLH
jgi:hypothetical protein